MAHRYFESKAHIDVYAKYRPKWGNTVYDPIVSYLKERSNGADLALDIGCGSGQSTPCLTSYFNRVIGFDVSQAQIDHAESMNNNDKISYRVAAAESLPVEDNSADLITVAVALHWFDHSGFYKEVERVLKPGAVVASFCYGFYPVIVNHPRQEELTAHLRQMIDVLLFEKKYWHERDLFMVNRYTADCLKPPYLDTRRIDGIPLVTDADIGHLEGYLMSRSGFNKYVKAEGQKAEDWIAEKFDRFREIYGSGEDNSPVRYNMPTFIVMGRKPPQDTE